MQQISRYEIEKELGRGALSATFEARDSLGKAVAIRAVHVAALADENEQIEVRRALHESAKRLKRLEHRHIVPVREVIEEREFVHLVSEFVDAPRLHDILKPGQATPIEIALEWLKQMASALDEAHGRGIVHGALWPNNVFVESVPADATNAETCLRVADFVVARLVSKYTPHANPLEEAQRYLSPEQIQEAGITGSSDQFALGVLAYQLFTGTRPFDAEHLPTLYYRICKEAPIPAKELAPLLSDGANTALSRALSKSPTQRFSSCREFVSVLAATFGMGATAVKREPEPALATSVVAAGELLGEEPGPAMASTRLRSGERAYLIEEKNWGGRKLALAFVLGILIGAGIWVSRYWKASAPVPVQVADPAHSPSSPAPPLTTAKRVPHEDAGQDPENSATNEEAAEAKPKDEAVPEHQAAQPMDASQPKPDRRASKPVEKSVPPDKARDSHEATEVRLITDPVGARIVVDDDGSTACVAPCTINLPAGRHTLMATVSGFAPARRIFTLPADQEVTVVLPRSLGTLLVGSSPSGAQVLIDGQDRGRTPVTLRLPAGPHRLLVVLNGDLRAEQTVLVEADQIVSRTIRW